MNTAQRPFSVIQWMPRILAISFVLFLGIFALDAFSPAYSFWQNVAALLIHLVPNFLLLLLIVASWRREWIGGIVFPLLGILYIIFSHGNLPVSTLAIIAGPTFLLGLLYLLSWYRGPHARAA